MGWVETVRTPLGGRRFQSRALDTGAGGTHKGILTFADFFSNLFSVRPIAVSTGSILSRILDVLCNMAL